MTDGLKSSKVGVQTVALVRRQLTASNKGAQEASLSFRSTLTGS